MSKHFTKQSSKQLKQGYSTKALSWLNLTVCEPEYCESQPHPALDEYFRSRKKVFVDKLGWEINHFNDRETDEYDNENAYYCIILNNEKLAMAARGHRVGSPNPGSLIEALFQLYPDLAVPISKSDWDVTRLLLHPTLRVPLAQKIIGFRTLFARHRQRAKSVGCTRMLAVTNPQVPAHFAKIGLRTSRISRVVKMNENSSEMAVFAFEV
ncbi:acyl-homoserine-lactone synthase [Planktotalea sp.]|uniref:acyl-homoserine-lactone synthase n=1 Tax=Planktotalea sp. TaxID=2029877 RepID=UPI003D6B2AA5